MRPSLVLETGERWVVLTNGLVKSLLCPESCFISSALSVTMGWGVVTQFWDEVGSDWNVRVSGWMEWTEVVRQLSSWVESL